MNLLDIKYVSRSYYYTIGNMFTKKSRMYVVLKLVFHTFQNVNIRNNLKTFFGF